MPNNNTCSWALMLDGYNIHEYILKKDPQLQGNHCLCILTVCYILVEYNHFAQARKYIFGRRDVVESYKFHLTIILLFLKQTECYHKF